MLFVIEAVALYKPGKLYERNDFPPHYFSDSAFTYYNKLTTIKMVKVVLFFFQYTCIQRLTL